MENREESCSRVKLQQVKLQVKNARRVALHSSRGSVRHLLLRNCRAHLSGALGGRNSQFSILNSRAIVGSTLPPVVRVVCAACVATVRQYNIEARHSGSERGHQMLERVRASLTCRRHMCGRALPVVSPVVVPVALPVGDTCAADALG